MGDKIRALIAHHMQLTPEQAEEAMASFKPVAVHSGEWLFRQGDDGTSLFMLVRGRLQVWTADGDNQHGRWLGEVRAGETVGEIGLLTGQPRTAGIQASRDSQLVSIDQEAFEALSTRYPAAARALAGGIATRLQQRTSGDAGPVRRISNLCLLPLAEHAEIRQLVDQLIDDISTHRNVLIVDPDRLGDIGAPVTNFSADNQDIPENLKTWLDAQESEFDMCIYRCLPTDSAWTRFSVRQSDMVAKVTRTTDASQPPAWHQSLNNTPGSRLARHCLILMHPAGGPEAIQGTADWLDSYDPEFHLHMRDGNSNDLERISRILSGRAVGLVLSSGAARGLAHVGICRALADANIPIDWIGGSSIGAIIGGGIAYDLGPDDVDHRVYSGVVKGRSFSDYTWPAVSLLSGKRMRRNCRKYMPGAIEDLPIPYFCVSTNLNDGRQNLHRRGSLAQAAGASASLPGLLPPTVIDGQLTVDGAVINSLPVTEMRTMPVDKVIVVDLTSSESHRVDYAELPSGWRIQLGRMLPFLKRYRVPSIASMLLKASELGRLERDRDKLALADLIIRPPIKRFGMTETRSYHDIVKVGYESARDAIDQWLVGDRSGAGQ